jgi:hypothetical protein
MFHFVYNWYNNHKTDIIRIFNLLFVDDTNHIDQISNEEVFIVDSNYSVSNKGDELDGSEFERESTSSEKEKPLYRIRKEDLIAIGIVGSGSNGGDGSTGSDSSPTYLGIQNIIARCSKINSLIHRICCQCLYALKQNQIIDMSGIWSSLIDFMCAFGATIQCWAGLYETEIMVAYIIYLYLGKYFSKYHFDINHRVAGSAFVYTVFDSKTTRIVKWSTSLSFDKTLPFANWDLSSSNNIPWSSITNRYYSVKNLNRIMNSLGLVSLNNLTLSWNGIHNTHLGSGLKSLFGNAYTRLLVQVTTWAYAHKLKGYFYCTFHILVLLGIGVVVWYKFTPQDPLTLPLVDTKLQSFDCFKHPSSVVEGYKRITYWMTEDVVQTVYNNYRPYCEPFCRIVDVNQYDMGEIAQSERMACIGTAIMIASFITANVIIPVTLPPIQY